MAAALMSKAMEPSDHTHDRIGGTVKEGKSWRRISSVDNLEARRAPDDFRGAHQGFERGAAVGGVKQATAPPAFLRRRQRRSRGRARS